MTTDHVVVVRCFLLSAPQNLQKTLAVSSVYRCHLDSARVRFVDDTISITSNVCEFGGAIVRNFANVMVSLVGVWSSD